ncbi:PKD domain-containing protein [Carboxylicivirga sp. N1Y90]|uniref:PKD domain-containing protein n=1 Tax=Carboxylicivirga fragile TaxID=3417571 RepID=UPI003D32EC27|nr:PKD domain-containing protein [Marinilabiliaceae bacterium N1Y90]
MKQILITILSLIILGCELEDNLTIKACQGITNEGEIKINEEVIFTNCSENASFYMWNFGDGNVSTLKVPSHIYLEADTYIIELAVQNTVFEDLNGDGLINTDDIVRRGSDISSMLITIASE